MISFFLLDLPTRSKLWSLRGDLREIHGRLIAPLELVLKRSCYMDADGGLGTPLFLLKIRHASAGLECSLL
jgi:hypothetical protein